MLRMKNPTIINIVGIDQDNYIVNVGDPDSCPVYVLHYEVTEQIYDSSLPHTLNSHVFVDIINDRFAAIDVELGNPKLKIIPTDVFTEQEKEFLKGAIDAEA